MLIVENIQLAFERSVLSSISLDLKAGEIIGIVGKSGAGKTSLLKIIAGFLEPTAGKVTFEGEKVIGPATKLVPGHPEIQLVNQDFHLDTYHTVEENIREQILYLPLKQRDQLVEELLHLMELTTLRKQKATTLSGGEQQRLAIARALACEPKIILLDEPFVHLDGKLRAKLIHYLLKLQAIRKTSFMLVSHDGAEILSLCSVIYFMKNGKFVRKASPKDFYYKPKTLDEAKLFGPINKVLLNGKRILFRPDEYEIHPEGTLQLKYQTSLFTGVVYQNYFTTENKENILLYSLKAMDHDQKIIIVKSV
ncbi:MAG: ABC transporter ATP-binding protein [Crocinitomicaceae bacterium]|nr:ABC transporter ATP-binding protein [Crocinitomicaceae bacterium]